MKKIIGIDFDDIVIDFTPSLYKFYDPKIEKKDIYTFNLFDVWKCSLEESIKRADAFFETKEHFELLPVLGAKEAIEELSKQNELIIVSSRPENARGATEEWINKNFPGIFEDIVLTAQFKGGKKRKSDVCKELGITVFIEDALHNAKEIADSGIKVLMLDVPWNQNPSLHPNIERVFSWKEIVEKI